MITDDDEWLGPSTDAHDPNNLPVLLTVAEVAGWLRCSVVTVRRRIKRGELPAAKVGPRVMVHRRTVLAIFDAARDGEPR